MYRVLQKFDSKAGSRNLHELLPNPVQATRRTHRFGRPFFLGRRQHLLPVPPIALLHVLLQRGRRELVVETLRLRQEVLEGLKRQNGFARHDSGKCTDISGISFAPVHLGSWRGDDAPSPCLARSGSPRRHGAGRGRQRSTRESGEAEK